MLAVVTVRVLMPAWLRMLLPFRFTSMTDIRGSLLMLHRLGRPHRLHHQRAPSIRRNLLGRWLPATLRPRPTTLDPTRLWSLEVVRRNPFLGVAFRGGAGADADCGAIGRDVDGLGWLDGALAAAGALLGLELGEVRDDPDVVEGVGDANCAG
jgi:hypothetical protein